jgi:hypothetical protein
MADWTLYGRLKNLIDEYWQLKDEEQYDEFISKLAEALDV